jgi:putative ABC transport system permease protein
MFGSWSDVRYLLRGLIRTPVTTGAILLTLVICFGASTSIFSVVSGVLLSPLPFKDSDRLVAAWTKRPGGLDRGAVAPADFWDFRREAHSNFTDIAAVGTDWSVNGSAGGRSARLKGAITSSNLLSVLGVKPELGPGFEPQNDLPGGEHAVLLSYRTWRDHFGGDPGIVGKSILLDRMSFTVRGVLPERLRFPTDDTEIWLPPSYLGEEMTRRGESFLFMIARLKPGTGLAAGRAELTEIAGRLAAQYPKTNTGRSVTVAPLQDALVGEVRAPLYILLGAVGCMLLIACANVSGLLLGRNLGRQHEMAVRTALGAGRTTLVRQPLIESVLLTLLGGALGLLVARFAIPVLLSLSSGLPRSSEIGLHGRVFAVSFLIALFSGLVVGAVPAYWSSRADLRGRLAAGGRGTTLGGGASRMADLLIVAQIVLALVLLIGAGLLTKSFLHLIEIHPGFDPDHAITLRTSLPDVGYEEIETRRSFYQRLLDNIAAMPGVEAVGATSRLPMTNDVTSDLVIEGRPTPLPPPEVGLRMVSEDYFRAMRIPLIAGRPFNARDGLNKQEDLAVIVNQTLTRQFWPGGELPLGKRIWLGEHKQGPWMTIVGVVGDVHHHGLDADPEPEVFEPRNYKAPEGMTLVVRTAANPKAIVAGVRRAVYALDPTVPAYNVDLLSEVLDRSVAKRRFAMLLLLFFAGLALLLTLVGVYGSVAEWTLKHRRDLAIRLAIGAPRRLVLGLVIGRGMLLACAGLVIGLAAAWALRKILQSLLFGISSGDPITFLAMPLLLAAFALLAISLPAWRSARIDPLKVLREE